MRKFTKKIALAFGALLLATGLNTTKAQAGAALNFDAAAPADKIALPQSISTNSLVGGTKITVEAWVRPTNLTGLGVIVGNYSNPNNQLQFLLRRDNSGYAFYVGTGNTTSYNGAITAASTATANIWQHVAGVYDGSVIAVYINGVFSTSVAAAFNYTFAATTNSIVLGTDGINESFTGDMDEIRVWNTNRSKCEINTFMNCEIPGNATNLVANYHFNQGTAAANNAAVTTLNDATANAFNGTLSNFALTGATGNWVTPGGVVSGFTTALAPPTLTVNPSVNISTCQNNTVVLIASGASTYTWSGGVINAVAFTASATSAYTVNATAATGCTTSPAVVNVSTIACLGEALYFDGVNDNVNLVQPFTSDFSIEYWMKTTQTAGVGQWYQGAGIVDGEVGGVTNDMGTALVGSKLGFGIGNPDITITSTTNVNTGNWVHVAATWKQSTGAMKLYINGVLEATGTSATAARTATTNLKIGSLDYGTAFFNGALDEVRVWNVERTQCEINTFKNCEIPANSSGLVVNYHLNQGIAFGANSTVTIANDATSSVNNGTLTNFALATGNVNSNWVSPGGVVSGFTTALAPPSLTVNVNPSLAVCANNTLILTASGAGTYTWTGSVTNGVAFNPATSNIYTVSATAATGCTAISVANVTANSCPGEALAFDGSNDIVNIGTNLTNAVGTASVLTLEAWVRPTSTVGVGSIVSNHNFNSSFALRRNGNSYNAFVGFGTYNANSAANTVTLNVWQHVAMVFQSTSLTLYINGNSAGTTTFAPYTLLPSSINNATAQIGNNGFSEAFAGNIDEVRVWASARTACEINTFRNCEIPSNSSNLLANYHFNQGQAFSANPTVTTLTDATSSAFTGTLTNMSLTAGNLNSNWVTPGGVSTGYTTSLAAPGFTNSALAVCPNGTVILGGTNGTSYSWTPSITNNAPFTPTASSTYSFTGTNSVTSCSVTAAINVTVNSNPTVTAVTSETNVLCAGQSATLTANGASTYTWNTTATTSVIAISPTVTTTYTVTGTNSNGCSNVVTVTQSVSACTGIANNGSLVSLEIYPNPSNGMFNIKANSQVTIEIFDVLGNLLLKTDINSGDYKLNLGEQNKGLYLVKCTSQDQVKSYRLIKD